MQYLSWTHACWARFDDARSRPLTGLELRAIYCSRATLNYRIIIYEQLYHQNYNDSHKLKSLSWKAHVGRRTWRDIL